MEDFATFCKTEKHNKAIELQNSVTTQTGFIASRLNRDNFWNIVFLSVTTFSVGVAQLLMDLIPGGIILLFLTLVLAPYLITKANPLIYKDKIFHSLATNRAIASALPQATGFILFLSIPFTIFWVLFIHDKYPHLDENMAVYNAVFWFIPTIYFIIKNYPISMLFYKNAWYVECANIYSSNDSVGRSHNSFSRDISQINSPYNRRHNPINNYSATNSHYRK